MNDLRIMIYGYGNPGRMDDGLGAGFVEIFSKWAEDNGIKNIEFDSNYQLNIEDADAIADKDLVLFVDASQEEIENFVLTKVDDDSDMSFTSHEASPGYIFHLCKTLFEKLPATFLLHIKGYEWSFQEGLTEKASHNLMESVEFIKDLLSGEADIINNFNNVIYKNP